eukprot:GSChrysophyteH1.ASY1.ANO1.2653.1 assembled CDS
MGNSASAHESESGENCEPSYLSQASAAYDQVVNSIIRPPRCEYDLRHMGPSQFDFIGKRYQRKDFYLTNPRNMKLQCSHWEPTPPHRRKELLPCVIYMHGNSSSRIESLPLLSLVLSMGATLLTFDFSGSGMSDGEFVSLGVYERDDLASVMEYLRRPETGTSTIALYGRSMGAATAILHAERDPSIAGMILDSPFNDLHLLAQEIVERGRQRGIFAPSLLVSIALRFVRSSVKERAGFDIKNVSPISVVDRCFVPALFVAATGDNFIPPHHAQNLYDSYASDGKNIILVDGDHNSLRPRFLFDSVSIFLQTYLQIREDEMLMEGMDYVGQMPWKFPYSNSGYSLSSLLGSLGVTSSGINQNQKNHQQTHRANAGEQKTPSQSGHKQSSSRRDSIDEVWNGGDHDDDNDDDNDDDDDGDEQNAEASQKAKSSEGRSKHEDIGTGMSRAHQQAVESTHSRQETQDFCTFIKSTHCDCGIHLEDCESRTQSFCREYQSRSGSCCCSCS